MIKSLSFSGNQIFTATKVYAAWANAVIAKKIILKSDEQIRGLFTDGRIFADSVTVHSFIEDDFVYFLYRKGQNSQTSKLSRICINDKGSYKNKNWGEPLWTSFVSVPIRCCIQRLTYTFCFDKVLGASGLQIGRVYIFSSLFFNRIKRHL